MLSYIILVDKKPVRTSKLEEYHAFLTDENNSRIALTELDHEFVVSTVFLAPIDLGMYPPDLFETMVFKDGQSVLARKHQTWDEAATGHDLMVTQVKAEYDRFTAMAKNLTSPGITH